MFERYQTANFAGFIITVNIVNLRVREAENIRDRP